MSRLANIGIVVAGYVAALAASFVAGWWYDRWAAAQPYDTSGGMYAGGQLITELAVLLAASLPPTLIALWWLRRHEGFWKATAAMSLAFAAAGLLAVLSPLVLVDDSLRGWRSILELVRISQLLGVPLWSVAMGLIAVLAPFQAARRTMTVAVALELVIGVIACVHWFARTSPL